MDGINPTLAFAALFLGLSGHPREAAPDLQQQAAIILPADFGCAETAAAVAVPPAAPVGSQLMLDGEADGPNGGHNPDSDLGWTEPFSVEIETVSVTDETGCGTFAPQP